MTEKDLLSDGKYRLRAPEPEDLDVIFGMENDTSLWMARRCGWRRVMLCLIHATRSKSIFSCRHMISIRTARYGS